MNIIVGSTALIQQLGFRRDYKPDIDIWTDNGEGMAGDVSVMPSSILEEINVIEGYASPDDIMTIKLSHLPYDIKWWKHVQDYLVLKMLYKCEVNELLYQKLKSHWKEVHGNKEFLSLYKTKDDFFDDFVPKEHDHDLLHEKVAYPNQPIYKRCLKEGEQVAIDKTKFFMLEFTEQIKMFREEINVIALERWILNPRVKGKILFPEAYRRSVHKTVTALTKGWASEFICENLELFVRPKFVEVKHCLESMNYENISC